MNGFFSLIVAILFTANVDTVPELSLRMNFLSTFGTATEQASKLGMGKNNRIISMYQNHQVKYQHK
jgi:mitogen-activated protein kinase kinase 1 interacting protein 1